MPGLNNLHVGKKYHTRMNIEDKDVSQTGEKAAKLSSDCMCIKVRAIVADKKYRASGSGKSSTLESITFIAAAGAKARRDPRIGVKSPTSRILVSLHPEMYNMGKINCPPILEPDEESEVMLTLFTSEEELEAAVLALPYVFKLYLID